MVELQWFKYYILTIPVVSKSNCISESNRRICYSIEIFEDGFSVSLFLTNPPSDSEAATVIPHWSLELKTHGALSFFTQPSSTIHAA